MEAGDKVFIFDIESDLYCMTGEVIGVEGETVVVMVEAPKWIKSMDCIVDRFMVDKLYLRGDTA